MAQRQGKPRFWTPEFDIETRADGCILMRQRGDLPPIPRCLPDALVKWASQRPGEIFLAQRRGGGDWDQLAYAEVLSRVRALASGLLQLGLGPERPMLILSENSIEHALLGLAAQYVGVPYAPLSPAYSLVSQDHRKLRDIAALLRPGLVYASDGAAYGAALQAIAGAGHRVLVNSNPPPRAILFETLQEIAASAQAEAAFAAITGDTVAKYLFTSGSTGAPKAVINSQAMLTSNQVIVADCFRFLAETPPVVVDWAPWNHTASGNKVFNMVLTNGGTFYIDAGKPTPAAIGETIRNLKDISPTWYFNVPAGYDMLIRAMTEDDALRRSFFARLQMMMYAGAGMGQHSWDAMLQLARDTVGHEVLLTTGLGATETGPFALMCTQQQAQAGNVGLPGRGVTLKLVPNGDRLEARLTSPSITPGYFGDRETTAQMRDDEGFYRLGDALRPADPQDLTQGVFFDGRLAENFKLATGTWVAVGGLRAAMVDHFEGFIRDVVLVGEGRDYLAAIVIPDPAKLAGFGDQAAIDRWLQAHLTSFAASATGSATRVQRLILIDTPPQLDRGEITDKGSINQRAVLANRPHLVAALDAGGTDVLVSKSTRPAPA